MTPAAPEAASGAGHPTPFRPKKDDHRAVRVLSEWPAVSGYPGPSLRMASVAGSFCGAVRCAVAGCVVRATLAVFLARCGFASARLGSSTFCSAFGASTGAGGSAWAAAWGAA